MGGEHAPEIVLGEPPLGNKGRRDEPRMFRRPRRDTLRDITAEAPLGRQEEGERVFRTGGGNG